MQKRSILNSKALEVTLSRLCMQLLESHGNFADTVLLGMQPRGIYPARKIQARLQELTGIEVPMGMLDATFHRDDFRRRLEPLQPNTTHIPFVIQDKNVVLVDDVLYTGRSVRSSLDAMIAYGRPAKVELLVLVDRRYTRQLPIEATYTGRQVNSIQTERVLVEWQEQGFAENNIWLID